MTEALELLGARVGLPSPVEPGSIEERSGVLGGVAVLCDGPIYVQLVIEPRRNPLPVAAAIGGIVGQYRAKKGFVDRGSRRGSIGDANVADGWITYVDAAGEQQEVLLRAFDVAGGNVAIVTVVRATSRDDLAGAAESTLSGAAPVRLPL